MTIDKKLLINLILLLQEITIMGRRPFDSARSFEKIDENQNKCKLWDHIFGEGNARIKEHLDGSTGKAVKPCQKSELFLEAASVEISNKRAKTCAREQGNTLFIQFLS